MKQTTVKFLAAATVAFTAAFVAATSVRDSGTAASTADSPVLPVLQERVNDVASVVIETKDETVTLAKAGDGWTLAEKAGYPANASKVRELILAMRDARVIEEKTANQERFDKLGLDAPDAEDSTSKRVTLKDGKGETLTSLLVGDQRFAKSSGAPNPNVRPSQQYYLHAGGDAPAVLATGELQINASAVTWVEQQFLDVGRERIQAGRVTHPDGTVVEAARAKMEDAEMVPLGTPPGMQPKEFNGTRPFLDALARLRFDDVKKAGDLDWDAHEVTVAEIFTEHNLRAKVETIEIPNDDAELDEDGKPLPGQSKVWARFQFDVADASAKPMAPAEEEPAEESSEEGEGQAADAPAPAEGSEDEGPTPAEQAKEVAELQKATDGWAYAIPSWKTGAFRMAPDALFEPIPEEDPTPELPPELMPAPDDPTSILDNVTPPPVTGSGDGN